MSNFEINPPLKYWVYGKKGFNTCSPVERPGQEMTFFDHSGTELDDQQAISLSSRRPWVKAGSVLALAGYMGQIACQFLACSLLWASRPLEAMEAVGKPSETVSFSCQLPVGNTYREAGHQLPAYQPLDQVTDPRREALLQNIITVTQAEYDWPSHVVTSLRECLPTLMETEVKSRLAKLIEQIKQPEDLLFFAPGETERILYRKGLTRDHSVFGSFRSLTQQIGGLLPHLARGLQDDFRSLKLFYEGYIEALCCCEDDPDRKEELLEKLLARKVFLKTEQPVIPLKTLSSRGAAGELPLEPTTSLAPSSHGFYRISQSMARQLISKDRYGFPDKKNETGMRAVQSHGGVHFKFLDASLDDPRPGIEYMAYAFATALTSQFIVTPSILLKLEGVSLLDPTENFPPELLAAKQKGESLDEALAELHLQGDWRQFVKLQDHNCFVQASQTIGENNLAKILEENPNFQGDPATMGWQALFSLLTAPGDGKADNYSVEGNQVVGIDNDKLFYPALYQTKDNLYAGVNCVFYLLDSLMDNTLPDEVRKSFLALNPALVTLKWLGLLQDQNRRYQRLADLGILKPQDLTTLGLPICLSAGLPEQIMNQMIQLQGRLQDHPASTPQQLLYSLHPVVADYYQALRERYQNDPLGAMWVIYKGRDQAGSLQTIDKVLSLSPIDKVWQQSQKNRTNLFNEDLTGSFKAFMPKIPNNHLKGHLNQLLSLILGHFKEWADELLPALPKNVWHQIVQEQCQQRIYNPKIFDWLRRQDPAGLNRLDAEHKTPLDEAFKYLMHNRSANIVIDLITRGAWQLSLSGRQYRDLKSMFDPQQQDRFSFWKIFQSLQERNAKVNWTVTLEELFPLAKESGQNTIQGTSNETRLLTETVLRQLNDPHHEITQGRRKVVQVAANGCFAYLKFYPELVGLEEAVGELTRRTIGFGAPYGELFRFPDGKPVWISQGIPGQTLQWVLTKDPNRLAHLDPVSTTQFILMSMLTNPEDGKPDNYIVEPLSNNPTLYRLSCPDNDHGFVPAFVKTKPKEGNIFRKPEMVVQVKTILYCLDLMKEPIPDATRALFLSGDPIALMQAWLQVLDCRNQQYGALYPSREASVLFKNHQCFMGVPFQQGMISHLYSKWVRMQDCLEGKFSLTPLQLLGKLEPRLANRYRAAFENPKNKTVWDRFKWVDGDFYHQQGNHWTTLTPSGSILTSQNIPMQESALEAIRKGTDWGPKQAIMELAAIWDQKARSKLSVAHMLNVEQEKFLKNFDFSQHAISEQRNILQQMASHAVGLRKLTLKNCTIINNSLLQRAFLGGDLVYLDLNGCTKITHDILPVLSQNIPGLKVLNLSNLPQLKRMANRVLVAYSSIIFKQLHKLNLNNCPSLETIDIDAPNLTNLWVEGARGLEVFKVKAAIDDEVFYNLFQTLEAPNLKVSQIDIASCPNITAETKKILQLPLFYPIRDLLMYPIRDLLIYQRFLNGVLIYKGLGRCDVGLHLPIAALANPLEGTFDLSQCGNISKYLSISTGYCKGKKPENAHKIEIWITPRFLVEKEINGNARHFKEIFPAKWPETAPVGIFWIFGDGDDMSRYDYLTTQTMDELKKNALHLKYSYSCPYPDKSRQLFDTLSMTRFPNNIYIHFMKHTK